MSLTLAVSTSERTHSASIARKNVSVLFAKTVAIYTEKYFK
jgi:hypothetical protein